MIDIKAANEFFLSEDGLDFDVTNAAGEQIPPAWSMVEKFGNYHVALLLNPGDLITTHALCWPADGWVNYNCQLEGEEQNGAAPISIELFFVPGQEDGHAIRLFGTELASAGLKEMSVMLDLSIFENRHGSLEIRTSCSAGICTQKIAIVNWVAAARDRLGLMKARTHRTRRLSRELEHFSDVYEHEIYAQRNHGRDTKVAAKDVSIVRIKPVAGPPCESSAVTADDLLDIEAAAVKDTDDVYHYAHRVLGALLKIQPPDFSRRIRDAYNRTGEAVRMMSLCSGAAGVERQLIRAAECPVKLTLFDINEHLMKQAASSLTSICEVSGVLGDVNEISTSQFEGQRFDIIACVSGLHHVVELEHVLSTVDSLLDEGGEFWIVGEQIGRDGNQLWPEAIEAANAVFESLPASLRLNAHTGKLDEKLQACDFSAVSFEGIRSSEIEGLLSRYFEPVHLYRRNCFLWRLLNPTYFRNYDLREESHRRTVLSLVAGEYNLWRRGGRSTESHSVYRRR